MSFPPGVRIGPFEVTAQIGEGGMGTKRCRSRRWSPMRSAWRRHAGTIRSI